MENTQSAYTEEHVRADQDEEWGGPDHDDKHPIREWPKYISKQNLLAVRSAMDSEKRTGEGFALEAEMFESRMLRSSDWPWCSEQPEETQCVIGVWESASRRACL